MPGLLTRSCILFEIYLENANAHLRELRDVLCLSSLLFFGAVINANENCVRCMRQLKDRETSSFGFARFVEDCVVLDTKRRTPWDHMRHAFCEYAARVGCGEGWNDGNSRLLDRWAASLGVDLRFEREDGLLYVYGAEVRTPRRAPSEVAPRRMCGACRPLSMEVLMRVFEEQRRIAGLQTTLIQALKERNPSLSSIASQVESITLGLHDFIRLITFASVEERLL